MPFSAKVFNTQKECTSMMEEGKRKIDDVDPSFLKII